MDVLRHDREGRDLTEIFGPFLKSELNVLTRLLARLGDVHQGDQPPLLALHGMAVLRRRFLAHAPVIGVRRQCVVAGAADRQHAEPVPPRRQRPRRRARAGDRHFDPRHLEGRYLQACVLEVEPVRLQVDHLTVEQLHDGVERLVHHAALRRRIDPHAVGVAGQRAGPDAEHEAAAGHVIELRHPPGHREGVVIGQRHDTGPEPDVPRALRRAGDEQFRAGEDFHAAGMVLADPGLVISQPVEMLEQKHVPLHRLGRVLLHTLEGGQKDAEFEIIVRNQRKHRLGH